jgi:predicted Zn-dependent peptidase
MRKFHTRRLRNGTTVVLVPHADTMAATVLVLYGVGSRYEGARANGSAHFIEHMMFKGTKRRPDTKTISRELDGVGADYNAFTGKDYTGYYIRLTAEKLPMAVDMLHDMVSGSLYRPKDLESERQVILEEVRMYEDSPSDLVDTLLEEELYAGSALGRPIGGTVASVSGLRRADLLRFRDRHYRPGNTVIALAGRFDEEAAMAQLERTFGSAKKGGERGAFTAFSGRQRRVRVALRTKETEQAQIAIGFRAYRNTHPMLPALGVLATILGGTMSSRLFMRVREKEGLCYSIHAGASSYQDTGDLTVNAGLSKDRLDRALALIMKELARIRDTDVTSEELSRAKEYQRGKLLLSLEDSSRAADWYARQELLRGRIDTPDRRLVRVLAVTKADIRKVAKEVIRADRMSIAAVGPFDDKARFEKLADALS